MSKPRLEAVLWDMDGVIADTMQYHCSAWQDILKEMGVTLTNEEFRPLFGQRHDNIIRYALGNNLTHAQIEALSDRKQALYRQRVAKDIRALPGAIELIKSLNKNKIKTALASSATQENIDIIVKGLKLEKYFQAYVGGPEVAEGKPSPLIFQLAAKKLGTQPSSCVVIEDAIAGVTAAKTAGMKCVAVTNSHPREKLSAADLIVDSLKEVNVETLKGLFSEP
jgi:beta-phosphoglucomutase family hydrolase